MHNSDLASLIPVATLEFMASNEELAHKRMA